MMQKANFYMGFSGGDIVLSLSLIAKLAETYSINYVVNEVYSDLIRTDPNIASIETFTVRKVHDSTAVIHRMIQERKDEINIFPQIYPDNFQKFLAQKDKSFKWHLFNNAGLELTDEWNHYKPEIKPEIGIFHSAAWGFVLPKNPIAIDFSARSLTYDRRIIINLIKNVDANFVTHQHQLDDLDPSMREEISKKSYILPNISWREWLKIIGSCERYIGLDSGISYLAAFTDTPSLIFRTKEWTMENSSWGSLFPWRRDYKEINFDEIIGNPIQEFING